MEKKGLAKILKISLLTSALVLLSGCIPPRNYNVYSPPRIYHAPREHHSPQRSYHTPRRPSSYSPSRRNHRRY